MRLILASGSPRRAELLKAAGFTFEIAAVDVDERRRAGESPAAYVRRLAGEKSAKALALVGPPDRLRQGYGGPPKLHAKAEGGPHVRRDSSIVGSGFSRTAETAEATDVVVIGADTAVVVDGEVLGKPRGDEEARAMLRRLSGRSHEVLTGVSVRTLTRESWRVETTGVWFAPLTAETIDRYVSSGEGRDKAGAYAIQGLASRFVPRIEGSYSNVVGLPVAAVDELLREIASER